MNASNSRFRRSSDIRINTREGSRQDASGIYRTASKEQWPLPHINKRTTEYKTRLEKERKAQQIAGSGDADLYVPGKGGTEYVPFFPSQVKRTHVEVIILDDDEEQPVP